MLLDGLPADNAIARAHVGHSWTTDVPWLLANLVDAVNMQVTLTHNANQPAGKQIRAPDPVARPDTPAEPQHDYHEDQTARQTEHIRAEMDTMRGRLFTPT